jgi:hypothetical protein
MSILTEIMDRLSGIGALKERVTELSAQLNDLRRIAIEQQKDIAEPGGKEIAQRRSALTRAELLNAARRRKDSANRSLCDGTRSRVF